MVGESCVQFIMVDSTPTWQVPPSKIKSSGDRKSDNSSLTASAVVGDTLPNLFALGATTPYPPWASNSFNNSNANGWDETLIPTLS